QIFLRDVPAAHHLGHLGHHDVIFGETSPRCVEQRRAMGRTFGNDSIARLADHNVRCSDDVFVLEAVWQAVWRSQYGQAARRAPIAGDAQAEAPKRREDQKRTAVDSQYPSRVCWIACRSACEPWDG